MNMMTKTSALKAMGLNSNASAADIKTAWRKLAQTLHPDKNPGKEEQFKHMKAAYDYLCATPSIGRSSDQEFSKKHSSWFNRQKPLWESSKGSDDWGDWSPSGSYDGATQKSKNLYQSEVDLTLEQAYKGLLLELSFANLTGAQKFPVKIQAGVMDGQIVKKILTMDKNGVEIQINIVAKIDCGDNTVTWPAVPNLNSGGTEGSGNIERPFQVKWLDIMLGNFVNIQTIDGATLAVRVLPGIKSGSRIKVQGRGYWKDNNCAARGDLYLKVIPDVPKIADVSLDDLEKLINAKKNSK